MIQFNLYVVNFEKNHYIQDIDVYLDKCEKLYSDYNKIINRDFLEDKTNVILKIVTDDVSKKLKGFNYLRMEDNDSGRVRYYFIDNMKYLNDGTIQIAATLDPVNSFQTYIKQTKNFKQVKMKRRHKDRFSQYGYRIFDKVDEGFGDVSVAELSQSSVSTKSSYIIYSQPTTTSNESVINSTALIRRMWCPATQTTITLNQYKYSLDKDAFYNSDGSIKWNTDGTASARYGRMFFYNNGKNYGLTITINQPDNSKPKTFYADAAFVYIRGYTVETSLGLTIVLMTYDKYTFTVTNSIDIDDYQCYTGRDNISIYFSSTYGRVDNDSKSKVKIPDLSIGNVYYHYELAAGSETSVVASQESVTLQPLDIMNLRDSQLKQIVEIPFIPNTDDLVYTGGYEVVFRDTIDSTSLSSQKVYVPDEWKKVTLPTETTTKDMNYETKLYGSQCRSYYLAYDNNTMVLQPEYRDDQEDYMLLKSIVPLNMSNNLAFNISYFISRKPYDNWLLCSRNNNVTIYSNEYLNYIRTGYNYDVKNKQQQSLSNWVSFGLGIVNTGANIGTSMASADTAGFGALMAQKAVGTAVGTINSLTNNILAEQANERALEQKKQQAMNATTNASGSDDLVLFKQYSGNYIKFISTRPEEDIQQVQYQLFYEFGYADNTAYDVMPEYRTRAYFNYVQADIGQALPDDYIPSSHINEVVEAFKNGITFEWHGTRGWKLDNELYENYELF